MNTMASKSKRATIYFDPDIHKLLKLKAAETNQSVSDLVDVALRAIFLEDAEDLASVRERQGGSTLSYEEFVSEMKADGLL